MTKAELRKIYLANKKSLSTEVRLAKSRQITDRFFQHFDRISIRVLHTFLSIEKAGEIDTSPIIERVWRDFPGIMTVVPRINRQTDRLESVEYDPKSKLVTSSWGIREPDEIKLVRHEDIDLVVVPLLCFDRNGHRVGYGGGYYDRFLAECRADCLRVGVSYFGPVSEISDLHGADVKLDLSITPDKVRQFPQNSFG